MPYELEVKVTVSSLEEVKELRKELEKIKELKKEIKELEKDEENETSKWPDIDPFPEKDTDPIYPRDPWIMNDDHSSEFEADENTLASNEFEI